jgi:hypothetical protein
MSFNRWNYLFKALVFISHSGIDHPGNAEVTKMALELQHEGFDCRAIDIQLFQKVKSG